MSTIKERVFYSRVGETVQLDTLVTLSSGSDPHTASFTNAWGGFVYSTSSENFASNFAEVPKEVIETLLSKFEPIEVSLGDEAIDSLPAFTNGMRWNGWQVPYMTLETILEGTTDDGFFMQHGMDRVCRFLYVPAHNDLLEIENYEGGEFDEGQAENIDFDRILDVVTTVGEDEARQIFTEMGLQVNAVRKAVIQEEGRDTPTIIYNVGDGWCWEDAPETPTPTTSSPAP